MNRFPFMSRSAATPWHHNGKRGVEVVKQVEELSQASRVTDHRRISGSDHISNPTSLQNERLEYSALHGYCDIGIHGVLTYDCCQRPMRER